MQCVIIGLDRQGDSGGPLIIDGVQVGIVSYGFKVCDRENAAGAFVRVSAFRDWIDKAVSSPMPNRRRTPLLTLLRNIWIGLASSFG